MGTHHFEAGESNKAGDFERMVEGCGGRLRVVRRVEPAGGAAGSSVPGGGGGGGADARLTRQCNQIAPETFTET